MKKILVALCAVALSASVAKAADFSWSWWIDDDKASSNIEGCALGLGTERARVDGAQIALIMNLANKVDGGAQLSYIFNQAETFETGLQWAFINSVDKFRKGLQLGFANVAESSSLQIGLLCFNKTGFLPFFVFFNFDKEMFKD